jgi:hypothetical protein
LIIPSVNLKYEYMMPYSTSVIPAEITAPPPSAVPCEEGERNGAAIFFPAPIDSASEDFPWTMGKSQNPDR